MSDYPCENSLGSLDNSRRNAATIEPARLVIDAGQFVPIENRRFSAKQPFGRWTDIRSIWPSIVITISALQGGNSTGSAAIAKLCAACTNGIRRSPICNSKLTKAECPVGSIMSNSQNELNLRALQYCCEHDSKLDVEKSFGFGVHGSVFACLRATSNVKTALKIHERSQAYTRERDVYLRLRDLESFLLDFGGAYLDQPPDYDDDILNQWEREKQEQFEGNWPKASKILSRLRNYGIYVADVNPGNIGFVKDDSDRPQHL